MNINRISLIFSLENYTVFVHSIFKYSLYPPKVSARLFNLAIAEFLKIVVKVEPKRTICN